MIDDPPIPPCDEQVPIPAGARCQEASNLSRAHYIACGHPAVAVVRHEREQRSYYMCPGCTFHNVRNRSAKLIRIREDWKGMASGLPAGSYAIDP
jgi:hypothetical protein